MAKKSAHSEEELPFVALMDTMTNVVGVLIIVLVLTGLSLASVANKIISKLAPITPEQLEVIKEKEVQSRPPPDPAKEIAEIDKKITAEELELKKSLSDIASMDRTGALQKVKLIDLESIKKKIQERKAERDKKKQEVDTLFAEIDAAKKRLDSTPALQPPPPMETVKMPNPRALPKNPIIHSYLVMGDRLIAWDEAADKEEAMKFLNAAIPSASTGKDANGAVVFDRTKLLEFLNNQSMGSKNFEILMRQGGAWVPYIDFQCVPKPEAGEPWEKAKKLFSDFEKSIKSYKTKQNSVVLFNLKKSDPEAMRTYNLARELVDRIGVNTGWEMSPGEFGFRVDPKQFQTAVTAPPPKQDPNVIQLQPAGRSLD